MENEFTEVTCEVKWKTENALLVDDGDSELWIPAKFVNDFDDIVPMSGKAQEIEVVEWWAIKKRLV